MKINKQQAVFFFFQAEDGIRDIGVTGVQTCALPIWSWAVPRVANRAGSSPPSPQLELPPSRFMACASVSCASGDSAPSDIAPVKKRCAIDVAGSTCSSGTGAADRKSTRLNSSHANISYGVFCLKKKTAQSAECP